MYRNDEPIDLMKLWSYKFLWEKLGRSLKNVFNVFHKTAFHNQRAKNNFLRVSEDYNYFAKTFFQLIIVCKINAFVWVVKKYGSLIFSKY